jgi:hypothetical protein
LPEEEEAIWVNMPWRIPAQVMLGRNNAEIVIDQFTPYDFTVPLGLPVLYMNFGRSLSDYDSLQQPLSRKIIHCPNYNHSLVISLPCATKSHSLRPSRS